MNHGPRTRSSRVDLRRLALLMPATFTLEQRTLRAGALLLAVLALGSTGLAQSPQIVRLNTAQPWRHVEFQVNNVPTATNRFDPDRIRLDATFTAPSGQAMVVPGFWFQNYTRSLSGGSERLSASGSASWRLRYTPQETGLHSLSLTIATNGVAAGTSVFTNFTVEAADPLARTGYVQIAPGQQYFRTGDGQPLRLIGENVCWPGNRRTYDYDTWFTAMQAAGENFARLWMCPWAFGLECESGTLTNYRLDRAWQLDYVLQLAEQRGIFILLCLDYHGMFQTEPDYWGGNDNWKINPYNSSLGGPCAAPNAFFTNTVARALYQKRLRYLAARYSYSPNLLAWEFFNEIDNSYNNLNSADVAAWHGMMGTWLRTNDAFGHLITTSLTGSSDRPEIWQVPQLDFAAYHAYGEPKPAARLAEVAQSFHTRYGKPVMIGEFGVDWRGWSRESDPYLRGFRQTLWGGALGGSVGTAMPWWWENIHSENVYPLFTGLGRVLNRTGWGDGAWTPIGFPAQTVPTLVGDPISGGAPFTAHLLLSGVWGGKPSGMFAVTTAEVSGNAATYLNSFVHGTSHPDLRTPFQLSAWLTNNARLVLHLNSVSTGARLRVNVDGATVFSTNLANLDGTYNVNNEYNLDLPVNLPAGRHLITVTNVGNDWAYLDWVRLEQVLPARYLGNWQPAPDVIGLRGPRESLLYVIAPNASYPGLATNTVLPIWQGATITLTQWPAGPFYAAWYEPTNGANRGLTLAVSSNGNLTLPVPDFREDLAAIVHPPPSLTPLGTPDTGGFPLRLDSETGGSYDLVRSTNLWTWQTLLTVTNTRGTLFLTDSNAPNPAAFYRVLGAR